MASIFVGGMTSSQSNPDRSARSVTFAWMLSEALRDAGHAVEHRTPLVEESLDEFDHVFIGLAPLHGLGSNRAYGALSAILRTIADDRLTLYIDDPDLGKVISGIRTNVVNPERFQKPFFSYKLQWDVANTPQYKDWLASGVRMLNENAWPQLLVPVHEWDAENTLAYYERQAPQATGNVVGIDLSAYLPVFEPDPAKDTPDRVDQWITESKPSTKWMDQQRLQFPVRTMLKNYDGKRRDAQLVELYRESLGVLQAPIKPPGWWHSRIGYAAQAGAIYCTKRQDVQALGDAYTQLPDRIECMGQDERDAVACAQRAAFDELTPDRADVQNRLDVILGTKVSA